jgi:epoxyqueuosine reductase
MNSQHPAATGPSSPVITYDEIRALAVNSGFTEAGLVALPHSTADRDADRFEAWVREGRAATMRYLARVNEEQELVRARVATPFPWARSAIVCMANYNSAQPKSIDPALGDAAWIARYAWSSRVDSNGKQRPSDYHKVLLKRLKTLESKLRERFGDFESRTYVDTGPVVERALATAAGLGWSAKNTCLIHPKFGSYAFLAVLLTSLEAEDTQVPTVPDRCGSCTRCIDACPTGALIAPRELDARLCISYLTIEHPGPIAPHLMEQMGRQVFGCDICQDVCPWNLPRRAPISVDDQLQARAELVNPALEWLAAMDEQDFERTFNGSPVRRAQYDGLRRNVAIAMGNAIAMGRGQPDFAAQLRAWATAADDGLRSAAQWALDKLQGHAGTKRCTAEEP